MLKHLQGFENNLLSELGYGYDLENDVHGDDIAQEAYYQYQSQSQKRFNEWKYQYLKYKNQNHSGTNT
jgi:hypothetical protein